MSERPQSSIAALGVVALSAAVLSAVLAGCGSSSPTSAPSRVGNDEARARSCDEAPAAPLGRASASGSSVALVERCGTTLAYVADEDAEAIRTIDVDAGTELALTRLGGAPVQLVVGKNGEVLVSLRDQDRVEVLSASRELTQPLRVRASIPTPAEPVGLALDPAGEHVFVSSRWDRTLTGYALDTHEEVLRSELPRDPHAVLVSDDGSKVFVSHVVGSPSVVNIGPRRSRARSIELEGEAERFGTERRVSRQGYALAMTRDGRILAPQVLVDPGNPESRSGGYGSVPSPHVPNIAVIDQDAEAPLISSLREGPRLRAGWNELSERCLLPRAAVVDDHEHTLLVACLGVASVVEYDAMSANPNSSELRRWHVSAGPTGIALDSEARRAVVWSQFEQTLNVIELGARAQLTPGATEANPGVSFVATSRDAHSMVGDLALGRQLFHAVAETSISRDGRACASCHPDGRDDGLTWSTPEGPRQTPTLAGRLSGTAPYGWVGGGKDLSGHLTHTFSRLRGEGLRGRELAALIAYISSMDSPAPERRRSAGREAAQIERGAALFNSPKTACATCHNGAQFADGQRYDVGSRASADETERFDTPSLIAVGGSAPYFHDGRYATLQELLRGSDGQMGHTAHLPDADIDALAAYLETL